MAKNKEIKKFRKADPSGARRTGVLTNPIRNMLITTLVCVVLGIAFLFVPEFVYDYSGFALGGLVCFLGLLYILIYFFRKPVSGVYRSEFAVGMVALSAGAWLIYTSYKPDAIGISITLRLIVTALGVLVAADGILKLQYTLDLARMKFKGWWLGFILSLLGICLGVLTALGFVDSFGVRLGFGANDLMSAMILLGSAFLCNAGFDFLMMILVAVRNRKSAKADAAAAAEAAAAEAAAAEAAEAAAAATEVPSAVPAAPVSAPVVAPAPVPAPVVVEEPAAETPAAPAESADPAPSEEPTSPEGEG